MADRRFFTLPEVAEQLNISMSMARKLVSSGEIEAIQIGGNRYWRIEDTKLEEYIERQYAQQRRNR